MSKHRDTIGRRYTRAELKGGLQNEDIVEAPIFDVAVQHATRVGKGVLEDSGLSDGKVAEERGDEDEQA